MRHAIVLPLVAVLSLAACNKGGSGSEAGGAAAGGSAADKIAAAVSEMKIQPGLYQSTVEMKAIDMPGLPPAVAEGVKKGLAGKPLTYCITPEDAAKGIESMKQHMAKGQCQFDKFNASGGTIDNEMTCQTGKGSMHVVGHGTYTDTGSVVASTADMSGPGGKMMHMEQVTTTKRIGDCTK